MNNFKDSLSPTCVTPYLSSAGAAERIFASAITTNRTWLTSPMRQDILYSGRSEIKKLIGRIDEIELKVMVTSKSISLGTY